MPCDIDIAGLVRDHHADVYRYAYRLSGRQSDAEDIAQETFLTAQQKLSQLRDADKARGWLLAIARTSFLKARRRRRPVSEGDAAIDLNVVAVGAAVDQFDGVDLQEALQELPEDYRTVVLMFYFEFQSYREIADALSIPLGTVMSRLSRAKSHLRARLTNVSPTAEAAPLTGASTDTGRIADE